jgi:hypothetical protein
MNLIIKRSKLKIFFSSLPFVLPLFLLVYEIFYNNLYFKYFTIASALFGLFQMVRKFLRRIVVTIRNENITLFRFFSNKTFETIDVLTFKNPNFGRSFFLLKNGEKYYFNVSDLKEDDIDLISNHFSERSED